MNSTGRGWLWRLLALVAVGIASTGVAACGEDSDGDSSANSTPKSTQQVPADIAAFEKKAKQGIVEFQAPEPGSGEGLKLGFIALGDQVPFSKLVTDSMRENAKLAGADLVVCDSRLEGQKALDCAKTFKTRGVQGYLNFQVDQKLAASICKAGPDVPVIAVDITQKPCQVSFMGAANEYAGFIAGREIGKFAKEEWDCGYDAYVSLESTASVDATRTRMGGYRKGFQSQCPGKLKNERILDADRTDTARTKMTDTLTALPGQKQIVVVAINDDGILGALAAAKTAGRTDDIYVSGQGADPSAHCQIKNNPNWIADSAYFPDRYGEIGIPYLIKAVKGEKIPENLLVAHQLVNAANIGEFYDLSC